jgi:hypothetical protein
MRLASIGRYATGKAPFLGIPYYNVFEGRYRTMVFRREHLQAACACPQVSEAGYTNDWGGEGVRMLGMR